MEIKKGGKKEVGFKEVLENKMKRDVEYANSRQASDMLFYNNRARAIPYAEVDNFNQEG